MERNLLELIDEVIDHNSSPEEAADTLMNIYNMAISNPAYDDVDHRTRGIHFSTIRTLCQALQVQPPNLEESS